MPTRKKSATRPNSIAASNGLLRGSRAAIDRPIGVFDSGIGGLTVLKALTAALPNEDFIYLGDTARLPYGTKSNEVIVRYSKENTGFLLAKGIKMLVVACNTSSAVALDAIASDTMVPVIGVIEPGARAAAKASRNGKIGVIGTEATIASGAYTRAIQRLSPRCRNLHARMPAAGAAGRGRMDRQCGRGIDRRPLPRESQTERHRHAAAGMHPLPAAARYVRANSRAAREDRGLGDRDRGRRARPAADSQARPAHAAKEFRVSS